MQDGKLLFSFRILLKNTYQPLKTTYACFSSNLATTWGQLFKFSFFPLRNSHIWRNSQMGSRTFANFFEKRAEPGRGSNLGLPGDKFNALTIRLRWTFQIISKKNNFIINWRIFANFCKFLQTIAKCSKLIAVIYQWLLSMYVIIGGQS